MNEIVIADVNVSVKDYNGQRVVTFKDIDMVHGRTEGTARRNFNHNKKHFIEGEDFIVRNSYEAKNEYNVTAPNGLILLTESGYLMLAKSFTDDKAWDVQRALVKSYFRAKQDSSPQYEQLKLEEKPYEYFDKFYKGQPVVSLADFSHFTGIARHVTYKSLLSGCIKGTDYFHLEGSSLADFKAENSRFPKASVKWFIVITKSGFDKLVNLLNIKCDTPKLMLPKIRKYGVTSDSVCSLMNHVRREIKGVESLTYLLESRATEEEFNLMRNLLVKKLEAIEWWKLDVKTIKLDFEKLTLSVDSDIFCGKRGMKNI